MSGNRANLLFIESCLQMIQDNQVAVNTQGIAS